MKFHKIKGFDPVGNQSDKNGCQLIINPGENDVVLFKMDPRSTGFSLSHQVVQEEVVAQSFTNNTQTFEFLNSFGGKQATPDNPEPEVKSRSQAKVIQQEQLEKTSDSRKKRNQQKLNFKDKVEKAKRELMQNMKEQAEFLKQHGGLGTGMFSNFMGNIARGNLKGDEEGWGFGGKVNKY